MRDKPKYYNIVVSKRVLCPEVKKVRASERDLATSKS